MSEKTRVVYDCNTLLQALGSPRGPAGTCVQLAFDSKVKLFLSPTVLSELREAVSRPKVVLKLKLRTDRVDRFFSALEKTGTVLHGFAEGS
jgi:putative PIN family toxin of toxin-antitoxin system